MLMGCFVIVSTILFVVQVVLGQYGHQPWTVQSWYLHEKCGSIHQSTITEEMIFESQALDPYLVHEQRSCSVTIRPAKYHSYVYGIHPRLLVYFTRMNLNFECHLANVTLYDGPNKSYPVLAGTTAGMCGSNSELLDGSSFLHTTNPSGALTVNYIWSQWYLPFGDHHSFILRISTFYEGSCSTSDLHRCKNGRCVAEWLYCSYYNGSMIRACGDLDDTCQYDYTQEETISDTFEAFGKSLPFLIITVVIVITLIVFCKSRLCKDGHSDPVEDPEGGRRSGATQDANVPPEYVPLTSPDDNVSAHSSNTSRRQQPIGRLLRPTSSTPRTPRPTSSPSLLQTSFPPIDPPLEDTSSFWSSHTPSNRPIIDPRPSTPTRPSTRARPSSPSRPTPPIDDTASFWSSHTPSNRPTINQRPSTPTRPSTRARPSSPSQPTPPIDDTSSFWSSYTPSNRPTIDPRPTADSTPTRPSTRARPSAPNRPTPPIDDTSSFWSSHTPSNRPIVNPRPSAPTRSPTSSSTRPSPSTYRSSTDTDEDEMPQGISLPSDPPPSYEEAMAPSYEEVMANQDQYQTSTTQ